MFQSTPPRYLNLLFAIAYITAPRSDSRTRSLSSCAVTSAAVKRSLGPAVCILTSTWISHSGVSFSALKTAGIPRSILSPFLPIQFPHQSPRCLGQALGRVLADTGSCPNADLIQTASAGGWKPNCQARQFEKNFFEIVIYFASLPTLASVHLGRRRMTTTTNMEKARRPHAKSTRCDTRRKWSPPPLLRWELTSTSSAAAICAVAAFGGRGAI